MAKLAYTDADWERFHFVEKPADERSPAEVDRSRIIHSAAFRRLLGKTQVFGIGQDAFFRTRLTHSLEVAQIGKGLALKLGADAELCEAIALAHDIGHPPFGHKGEQVLAELMKDRGGFEANAQNFRVIAKLEVKYDVPIYGLNLTRAVLDGLLKYRMPFRKNRRKFYYTDDPDVLEVVKWAAGGHSEKPLEAEIVDWADDIAYSVHDLEDGIHAGMITSGRILTKADKVLARAQASEERCTHSDVDWSFRKVLLCEQGTDERSRAAARKQATSGLIGYFLGVNLASSKSRSREARHGASLAIPIPLRRRCEILKSLAYELMIDDHRVASLEARAECILSDLFDFYRKPKAASVYPEDFRGMFQRAGTDRQRARVACDFIAGMTDDYAERVYARLFTPLRVALSDY